MQDLLNGSCRETDERLSDHVEGTLQGWSRVRVLRHLARCELCRGVLESLFRTLEQLRGLGSNEEPDMPSIAGAVLARIGDSGRTA